MHRRDFIKTASAGAAALGLPPGLLSAASGMSRADVEARVKQVISKMTLEQKVFQMSGHVWRDIIYAFTHKGHGYTGYTPADKELGIPALKCLDGPRGVGFLYKTTCFPVGSARGASWDPDLEERIGNAMGYEARALGANMLLTPCINVVRHPSFGRAQETFGEDTYHLGIMGAAQVRGIQNHVMACPKHYACNNVDESRMFVNAVVDERTLREVYLPHFKTCVDAGAASVMSAYNDVNGELCAHNDHLLRDILKKDWGFQGLVVSDWIQAVEDTEEAALAGLDVEMPRPEYYGRHLVKAVREGEVPEEVINEAVTRILRQKFIFENLPGTYYKDKIAGETHAAIAREAAQKSMVLLKNQGNVLPISLDEASKIAVIGKLADKKNLGDYGSSIVTPPYAVTPLQGIKERAGGRAEVIHEHGSSLPAARKAAAEADAVIVVAGLTFKDEGEGRDREDLGLKKEDVELIKAVAAENKRTVVVLEGGSAITMGSWQHAVPAIIMAWYPGMEGGHAIADVLFGDVNPSGKLPVVFPKSKDQLFEFDNQAKEVVYDYYHGYRFFDKNKLEPEFPFGHGLSYTTYEYTNLRLIKGADGVNARVDVTNTGKVAGEEVVQLYVGYKGSKVLRPKKDLKGFKKVKLEPGIKRTVEMHLDPRDLSFYNAEKGAWEIEPIEYVVSVGPSAADKDLLTKTVTL